MQPDSLASVLTGQDAVLSVVGKSSLRPMTFYRESARMIAAQMQKAGVERLVCLTSVGVVAKSVGPWWYLWFIKPLLKHIYEDMRQMERVIRDSSLAWTIVRPSRLFDSQRTRSYRVGTTGELNHAYSISRADVADCMLNQLATSANWH